MEITIASKILDFASGLFNLRQVFNDAKNKQKEKISNFLKKISESLKDMADGAEAGSDISESCGKISIYMDNLMIAIDGFVSKSDIEKFSSSLSQALNSRGLIIELNTNEVEKKNQILGSLREASGKFSALAEVILL